MKTGSELRSEGSERQKEVEEGSVRVPIPLFAYTRRAPLASGCEFKGLRLAADHQENQKVSKSLRSWLAVSCIHVRLCIRILA